MSEWIQSNFLQTSFSERCSQHETLRNDKDHYCITCGNSICQFCIEDGMHLQHKVLKIYKHVYNDVVSLSAMLKHIDCSKIQPYRSNKRSVLALRALPHTGSVSRPNNAQGCVTCQRRISQSDLYSYCSISCQVVALSRNSNSNAVVVVVVADPVEAAEDSGAAERSRGVGGGQSWGSLRKRSRKGKPCRAPFF